LKLDVSFQILEEYFLNYAFFPKQWQHKWCICKQSALWT
jgi:hypothetical protein